MIDSTAAAVDEKIVILESIEKICPLSIQTEEGRSRYRLLGKVSIFGKSADGVIEFEEERVHAVTFSFDFIGFFESSVPESKLLKACKKSLNMRSLSGHRSTTSLNSHEFGQITFLYDSKRSDFSLDIIFRHSLNE